MKKKIKVKFVDFWTDFNKPDGNFFYTWLSQKYVIEFSEKPEILFYSCYGSEYLNYKCKRIFFSAENVRSDFTACDYAVTFDYLNNPRHYRFPLFGLYCVPENLIKDRKKEITLEEWKNKKKFCCIVVSNPNAKERIEFFHELSKYKKVDSGGKWNNNIDFKLGPSHLDKLNFIKDYKFVISFENSSYPGYTTEKIIEPLMVEAIPIYWGNPLLEKDINENRIINVHKFNNFTKAIERVIEIDNNDLMALEIVNQPNFNNNKIPSQINPDELLRFLIKAIESEKIPICKTFFGRIYDLNKYIIQGLRKLRKKLILNKINSV